MGLLFLLLQNWRLNVFSKYKHNKFIKQSNVSIYIQGESEIPLLLIIF